MMRAPVLVAVATAAFVGSGFVFTHHSAVGIAATKYCDGPKVTWRVSLFGNRRAVTEGMEYVSQAAKEATCDNFNLELFYAEQLSKSRENLDAIKVGAVQGALACASYHPAKVRALGVLDLPFLPVSNLDVLQEVFEVMYAHEAFEKALAEWGAKYYAGTILPQYEYMGRGKPPLTLADWKGKRVRALGGMGAAMEALGAVPTSVPAPETYTALQRGTIDAIGFPFSYTFAAYRLDEIANWYTTNMSAGSVGCIFAISLDAHDKLPEQYKTILDEAKLPSYEVLKAAYTKQDEINLPKWEANPKLQKIVYSEEELAEFRRVGGGPVWEAWVKENEGHGVPARELLDLVLKTAKEAQAKLAKK